MDIQLETKDSKRFQPYVLTRYKAKVVKKLLSRHLYLHTYIILKINFSKSITQKNYVSATILIFTTVHILLQIAVLSAEGATRFGLVRAAFALVGLALCVPLAGIMLLLLPAFAAARSLAGSTVMLRASISATLVAVPVALSWWLAQRHRVRFCQLRLYDFGTFNFLRDAVVYIPFLFF